MAYMYVVLQVIEGSHQLANLPKGERRAVIQVASNLWQVLGLRVKVPESTDYIRHSCNASCGLKVTLHFTFYFNYTNCDTYVLL